VELRLRSRSSGEIVFTVSPNRLEVSGGSPLRWTLEILTGGSPPDVYPLTLEASTPSGSPLRTVDLTLTVTPPDPALP